MTTELKQNKSSFKFIGKVTNIDKEGAFKEEEATRGAMEGKTYRALRFGVKTSETNTNIVEMFDYEPEKLFMWNSKKREKDKSYKGDWIEFDVWEEKKEELAEQGYAVLQTRVGLTYGEDGKLISKGLPNYVASQLIYEGLSNGDSVVVEGEIRYSKYKNRDDKMVERKTYVVKKVFRVKDVDFDAENFEEITYFEQEMVYVDAELDQKEGKAYVTGRIIDYKKNWHDTQMEIVFKDNEGNVDSDMKKLADAFAKKIKFGDLLKVYGNALNRVIVEEVEGEEEKEDDLLGGLGGRKKPKHAETYVARTYINAMQIEGVDAWDKKMYTEDSFVKDDLLEEDETSGLGGKKKKTNPFADTGSEDDPFDGDLDESDLPF